MLGENTICVFPFFLEFSLKFQSDVLYKDTYFFMVMANITDIPKGLEDGVYDVRNYEWLVVKNGESAFNSRFGSGGDSKLDLTWLLVKTDLPYRGPLEGNREIRQTCLRGRELFLDETKEKIKVYANRYQHKILDC